VEASKRNAARICRREPLDRPPDLAAHALDSRRNDELRDAARHGGYEERDTPNARRAPRRSAIQERGQRCHDNASDEYRRQYLSDECARQRSGWQHGEGRWRDHTSEQDASA